jgi:arylsulfatase B
VLRPHRRAPRIFTCITTTATTAATTTTLHHHHRPPPPPSTTPTRFGDLGVGNCNGSKSAPDIRDIWVGNATAPALIGNYTGTRFNDAAVRIISSHDPSTPLFLYLALHNTHAPLESLPEFAALYPGVTWPAEKQYLAMTSTVDSTVANVTAALKAAGMWDNAVVFWATDNGAPVQVGGSNGLLRGGKGSNWEGGFRCPAIVSGGALPAARRGTTTAGTGFMHIVDLYATFLSLAGVSDPSDPGGPAPVESMNVWPWLSGAAPTSPRTSIALDHSMYAVGTQGVWGALRVGDLKLLVGARGGEPQASWYGEFSPNASVPNPSLDYYACGNDSPTGGCVFNISADPTEHVDLAPTRPDLLAPLLAAFRALNASYHPPVDNPPDDKAGLCAAALAAGGIVTPWRDAPVPPTAPAAAA